MNKNNLRNGFTLMELLVYIGLLAIILNFIFLIYYNSNKIIIRSTEYSENMSEMQLFINCFQKDVRNASKRLPAFEKFKNSDHTLILQLPDTIIIYDYNERKNVLKKTGIIRGKIIKKGKWNFSSVHFTNSSCPDEIVKARFTPAIKGKFFKSEDIFLFLRMRNGT